MQPCFSSFLPRRPARTAISAALAALTAMALGCGGSEGPRGTVAGKVTAGGQPVTKANVQFVGADGVPVAAAPVNDSGDFTMPEPVPVGAYQVAVLPDVGDITAEEAGKPEVMQAVNRIPPKYRDHNTSGLKAEVKEGENTVTIALE